MNTEKSKKLGVKRETRTDSENEPTRVYRPRTIQVKPVSSSEGNNDDSSEERSETTHTESDHSTENFSSKKSLKRRKDSSESESQDRETSFKKKEERSSEGKSTYKPRTFKVSGNDDYASEMDQNESKPSFSKKEDESFETSSSHAKRHDDGSLKKHDRSESRRKRFEGGTSRSTEGKSTGYRSSREDKNDEKSNRRTNADRNERMGESRKPFGQKFDSNDKPKYGERSKETRKPYGSKSESEGKQHLRIVLPKTGERKYIDKPIPKPKRDYDDKPFLDVDSDGLIRLNKYISNTGLCSRREADEFIQKGMISVNGVVVSQLGTKVDPNAEICFKGKKLETEHKVYILLNKPKDFITTVEDPNAKRTVMDLIEGACTERVYPVGRLDRNSTGLLLLTNDGEMTKRLTHPSFMKKKIYYVGLDKVLTREDMKKMITGVEVNGEIVKADAIDYTEGSDGTEIGVEIHTGQNRIVRNMFDTLGYKVSSLDRVYFAGLTKKNLPRGKWRFLTQQEINMLKMNRFE